MPTVSCLRVRTATQRKAQIRSTKANLTSENEQLRIEERQERFGEDVWKNSPFDPTKDVQEQTMAFVKTQNNARKAFLEQATMKREADMKAAADSKAAERKKDADAKAAEEKKAADATAAKSKAKRKSRAKVQSEPVV